MNRTFALLSSSIFSMALLSSCATSSGDGSGDEIKYPTVADVERIDRQMGLEPRQLQNRNFEAQYTRPTTPAPAPAPTPDLAPAPTQEATPPPQPSVDADTLQKLR